MSWLPILYPSDDKQYIETVKTVVNRLRPAGGVILVFVANDESIKPFYLGEYDFWNEFDREDRLEAPALYISLPAALRKLRRVKPPWRAGEAVAGDAVLALWRHPDAGQPLQKYMEMTGHQFPGSPTQ